MMSTPGRKVFLCMNQHIWNSINLKQFPSYSMSCSRNLNMNSQLQESDHHEIVSILKGCRSFKDCYEVVRTKEEYILLLNSNNSSYTYQHHKYFILYLIERASKDEHLSWSMIWNLIQFYSNFKAMYHVPIESIYRFLSILSQRGDFSAVSCIIERLISSSSSSPPTLAVNNRIFCILIESLRNSGQSQKGYHLFEESLHDFNVEASLQLLLNGYMCNPSKYKHNFILLLNEYHLQCDAFSYNALIQFHLKQCTNNINVIQLHAQRVLFYLNHAHSSHCYLKSDVFNEIIGTSFNDMLHNKLCSDNQQYKDWITNYIKHILFQQLQNHSSSFDIYKHQLSNIFFPIVFELCLNRNHIQLARDMWQFAESLNIEIDKESHKHYKDLCIRHFVRHGKRSANDAFNDTQQQLSVFPADATQKSSLQTLLSPNEECLKLAKNLLQRADTIALHHNNSNDNNTNEIEPRAKKTYLIDMQHAITFCRKYNDITSGRMLYEAFIKSSLSFKYHAALATDFLFLLDRPQLKEIDEALLIAPKDVMTLWPLHPPQAFINKAFTVLITCKNAEGIKKLLDTVTMQTFSPQTQKKTLSLSPKMIILASNLFANECKQYNIYWDYLWKLMESKQFKSARTEHSVSYVGHKLLNILFERNEDETYSEDEMMANIKRIHDTFKNYNLPLSLPLMQKLHANLTNAMHKSWIRAIYIDEHHPDSDTHSMHIMNDYRWFIDSELFNKSLEEGLYQNLKPLRKLMIDGTIPISHRLIHRILLSFSHNTCADDRYLGELKQFLIECYAHYKHAFSPKEKSLIVSMIKRYMKSHTITSFDAHPDVSSIVSYLKYININVAAMEIMDQPKAHKSYLKHTNPKHDTNACAPTMSDAIRFNVGETVQLCGLQQHSYLNGNIATVAGYFNKETQTYAVQLKDNPHIVYVAARHMRFGKNMIDTQLPELQITVNDVIPSTKEPEPEVNITPFDTKQKRHHLRNKLLHIFKDQKADALQNGIALNRFKQLWQLYFPAEQFYHDDESMHDYIVMHVPFEVDYSWNINQYPAKPLERIYYLTAYNLKSKWQKLNSLHQFLSYLRDLIHMQRNCRMRLKDLCIACYADVYESHKLIRSNLCLHMLHFIKHHHNEFYIDTVNGEKYISLVYNDHNNKIDLAHYNVYDAQFWIWELYNDTKCNHNISISEWNDVLALFEGHHIDGNALINLTESDLDKMHIHSIGIKKLILSSVDKYIAPDTNVLALASTDAECIDSMDDDIEEPLFIEIPKNVLCDENFYECLMDYYGNSTSGGCGAVDDEYIYEHNVLEYYEMKDKHQWFIQQLIDYCYERFCIKHYQHNEKDTYCKIYKRNDRDIQEIEDDILQRELKHIIEQHPIGIDIVSLLLQYQVNNNGQMFQHNKKYQKLTDRLRAFNFIVTNTSSGYVVFDAYS